jgi:hypothetical protein
VFQILTNTVFLSGWGVVLLSALTTTILAGGPGVALGYMIHKWELFPHYTLRFLRLGLWLPVYLFWGLSIWRIPIHDDGFMLTLNKIGTGVMATGPSVFWLLVITIYTPALERTVTRQRLGSRCSEKYYCSCKNIRVKSCILTILGFILPASPFSHQGISRLIDRAPSDRRAH